MASAAPTPSLTREDANSLIRFVNTNLIVRQLQAILKLEGQPTSGLKAPLQKRLTNHIEAVVKSNNQAAFQRLKDHINRPEMQQPARSRSPAKSLPANAYPAPSSTNYSTSPANRPGQGYGTPGLSPNTNLSRIFFKESPFYTILSPLCEHAICPVMTTHRYTVTAIVTLSAPQVHQLTSDPTYRIMVYCAAVEPMIGFTRDTDISFPHQVELRVNDTAISGLNLRGLKNKPGSTRPADITEKMNIRAGYRNEITLTYAMTQKEFSFIINLVKSETVENLVERLRRGSSIAKETVIADMVRKNEDTDLVATSTIMSLKCPLSTLRIDLPVRSSFCTHVQCFDATSFLQLQQQAPTWTCPTCNKSINFKQLVVDRYFDDILNSTPKSVDSVTIDSDGRWFVAAESSNTPVPDSSDDENGDYMRIESGRPPSRSLGRSAASSGLITPASNFRDDSLPAGRPNNKRTVSQVIDLTLSDDEDYDEPMRPSKRNTAAFPTPSSFVGSDGVATNGYSSVGTPHLEYEDLRVHEVDYFGRY